MYIIYGMPNCGYCTRATALLDNKNLPYQYHDVMVDTEQRAIMLEKLTTVKTLPQIFLNNNHIGGYTELVASIG
jgi:glutaredoxin